MNRPVPGIFLIAVVLLLLAAPRVWGQSPGEAFPIPYALADGTRLTGYLSLPGNYQEGKRYPAILLIHGGLGDGKGVRNRADGFLKTKPVKEHLCRDYVVFSAAYHTDYFGGPQEIESLAAALKALAGLPQVDSNRIAALGVSHGGYLALMCAVNPRIPLKIKAAVSISGVVDVGAFLQHRFGGSRMAAGPAARALGWPPDRDAGTRENFARLSVLTYLDNLQVPVLVIHGTKDNLVPVSQARSLKEALEKQKKPFEYLELPTGKIGGHFIFLSSKEMWEKIGVFLKKFL
jgi:dipeptidyl aminopeptidase/acylaminoacyl peptidase